MVVLESTKEEEGRCTEREFAILRTDKSDPVDLKRDVAVDTLVIARVSLLKPIRINS